MTCSSLFRRRLTVLLVSALALRLLLAATTAGYPYDTGTFSAWASLLAEGGPSAFYTGGFFADYPPGYLYLLWGIGALTRALGLAPLSPGALVLLCTPPILCDLALALLLARLALPRWGERCALLLTAAVAFNPALIFDCAVWKQVDSALALALVAAFVLADAGRYFSAAGCFGVALALKPQALIFGPVFALGFLLALLRVHGRARLRAAGRTLAAGAVSIGAVLLLSLPFTGDRTPFLWLIPQYFSTFTSYPYASVNAFNWMALLGGNWQSEDAVFLLLSWKTWGILFILLLTIALVLLVLRGRRLNLPLLAALYGCGVFLFSHRMHERYLFPALVLLLAGRALSGDRRLNLPAALLTFSLLLNMVVVYASAEQNPFLEGTLCAIFIRLGALATLLAFGLLVRACLRLPEEKREHSVWQSFCHRARSSLRGLLSVSPLPVNRFSRRDALALSLLTLFAGCLSLPYLGTTAVPQSACTATAENLVVAVELPADCTVDSIWVYPGIADGRLTVVDEAGETVCDFSLSYTTCFSWQRQEVLSSGGSFTLFLSGGSVNELVFADETGAPVCPTWVSAEGDALFDEQALLPDCPSQLNGMYFDEIYHARTGYETLHGLSVYETTHPPLGKDLIALGIALFGMNPFGWRIMGVLFGIAMVPVFYLLARQLLGRFRPTVWVSALFCLDFMRYTQSRIATIDVFAVFFVLAAACCMIWFCRRFLATGRRGALLPAALGGVAFGLGCASKWTGLYAGAGLAAIWFFAMAVRWRREKDGPDRGEAARDLRFALIAGFVFYLLVPLAIYLASYLPLIFGGSMSWSDLWPAQLAMFRYHSQLTATHPFSSAWYTWPLLLRPVWYYMGSLPGADTVASIAAFGNPVVWWGGLAGILLTGIAALRRSSSRRFSALFVLLLYAAVYLPWAAISRACFIYHYFTAMPFALLGLGLAFCRLSDRRPVLARRLGILLLLAAAALFCFFFPALSGLPVSTGWAAAMLWLPGWGFYIL